MSTPTQPINPPAGWYRDPGDPQRMRWWAGDRWANEYTSPEWVAAGQLPQPETVGTLPEPDRLLYTSPKSPRRRWPIFAGIIGATLVGLAILGSLTGSPQTTSLATAQTPPAASSATETPSASSQPPAPVEPAAPAGTVAELQALDSAQSYVDMSGFSKAGLLDQLTSKYGEGFSKADARWAVAHVRVNWNREAVEAGKSYLEMGGFSRSGLIEQLSSPSGDHFTRSQATYAANHLGL